LSKKPEISEFDRFIQGSLEGAKVPAPTGVWEGISASTSAASVASQAGLIAKMGGIKTIIIAASVGIIATVGTLVLTNQSKISPSPEIVKNEVNQQKETQTTDNTAEKNNTTKPGSTEPSGAESSDPNSFDQNAGSDNHASSENQENTSEDQVQNSENTDRNKAEDKNTEIAPLDFKLDAHEICRNEACVVSIEKNDYQVDFYWIVDGVKIFNKATINIRPSEAGTINLSLVSFPNGSKKSITKSLQVHESKAKVETYKIQKGLYSFKTSEVFKSYKWEFGAENVNSQEPAPRQYFDYLKTARCKVILWTVNERGCKDSVHTLLTFVEEPQITNIFTPYQLDGMNDQFIIPIEHEIFYHLAIFNNRGERIFESLNKDRTWDGTDSNTGKLLPVGAYTYKFVYQQIGETKRIKQGTVYLQK
jgi:hypothetical protein